MEDLSLETGVKFDCLVPVPLHFYRKNWRGFNQAEEIAKEIGKKMNLESEDLLVRSKMTKQQSLSVGKKDREKNVKGVFKVKEGSSVKGKNILIVDDVFNTGASMKECVQILKRGGAGQVWGLALAH